MPGLTTGVNIDPPLRDVAKRLKDDGKGTDKVLAEINDEAGYRIAAAARANAGAGTRQQARMAGAIAQIKQSGAVGIRVSDKRAYPFALAAFFGAERHTGWYAQGKYRESTGRQFPPWVGNSWPVGAHGEGPTVINNAIADNLEAVGKSWLEAFSRFMEEAMAG